MIKVTLKRIIINIRRNKKVKRCVFDLPLFCELQFTNYDSIENDNLFKLCKFL